MQNKKGFKNFSIQETYDFALIENGILLPKLFWPTVKKICSSDQENLLKFEAEGRVSFVLQWNGAPERYQMVLTYKISCAACLLKVWIVFGEMKEIEFIHCAPKLMEILQPTFLRKLMDVYIGEHAAMT